MKEIIAGKVKIGGENPIILIAGPCVIESEKSALNAAEKLRDICEEINIPLIYKSSYDKANRTSVKSFRGLGIKKGLKILKKVRDKFNIPVLSDIHKEEEIEDAAEVLDIIQIPAFLSRQTDMIIKAAKTDRVVNVKKGQFLAPWDIKNIIDKVESTGNKKILITERGVSFGYNNLVADMRALPIMRSYGYPVIFDATHSLQLPSSAGSSSGGQREFVPHITRAAVAAGCDGIFMEVHPNPDKAPCDGPNMLKMDDLPHLLKQIKEIDGIVKPLLF
ncbi:MAG TPA: 3-deoxy-8-phosphooctulonate synthase [Nitrospinota bacterium]|nr:3-deoxy-8-phosphooctulonate synthase [Nitrospinota bacterium]